jgi:tetratricopeptide (TPR) repeat protein
MSVAEFYDCLHEKLNDRQARAVLAALREDALVWQAVQKEEIPCSGKDAHPGAEADPESFSAVSLLMPRLAGKDLVQGEMNPPHWELKPAGLREGIALFEIALQRGSAPDSLDEAGMLALILKERYRLSGDWKGLVEELANGAQPAADAYAAWRTPIALMVGMVPERAELLHSLLAAGPQRPGWRWALHAVLCAPVSPEEQAQTVLALVREQGLDLQVAVLEELIARGRRNLAAVVAAGLEPFLQAGSEGNPVTSTLGAWLERAGEAQQRAFVASLAPETEIFPAADEIALGQLRNLEAVLALRRVGALMVRGKQLEAEQTLKGVIEDENLDLCLKAAALWQAPDLLEEAEQGPLAGQPLVKVLRAKKMVMQGDLAGGRELAASAMNDLEARPATFLLVLMQQAGFEPARWITTCLELGLEHKALEWGERLLAVSPNDTHLAEAMSVACERCGLKPKALELTRTALELGGERSALKRREAALCVDLGQMEAAYQAFAAAVEHEEPLSEADRLERAKYAVLSGRAEEGVSICRELADRAALRPEALVWEGKGLHAMGDVQGAVRALTEATLMTPDKADAWLALAEAYDTNGQTDEAVNALRGALLMVPQPGPIHAELGQRLLRAGRPSEALPHLREALDGQSVSAEVFLAAGQCFQALGNAREAEAVLRQGKDRWPEDDELAFALARTLQDNGDHEGALPLLEFSLQAGERSPEKVRRTLYALVGGEKGLVFGRASTFSASRIARARELLRELQGLEGDDLEVELIASELDRLEGKWSDAWQRLIELSRRDDTGSRQAWRLRADLAQVALLEGRADQALGWLEQVTEEKTDSPELYRLQCEAYRAQGLGQSALRSAQIALSLRPEDVENLEWFASQAQALGETQPARTALERAVALAPERVQNGLTLARLYVQLGMVQNAQDLLMQQSASPWLAEEQEDEVLRALLAMGDPAMAANSAEAFLRLHPKASAGLWAELGLLSMNAGNPARAAEAIRGALSQAPADLGLRLALADAEAAQKDMQGAFSTLSEAWQLVPGQSAPKSLLQDSAVLKGQGALDRFGLGGDLAQEIALRLALLLARQGKLEDALALAKAKPEAAKTHCGAELFFGELAMAGEEWSTAVEFLGGDEFGSTGAPGEAEADARLHALRAALALRRGDGEKAEEEIGLGLKANPQSVLGRQIALIAEPASQGGRDAGAGLSGEDQAQPANAALLPIAGIPTEYTTGMPALVDWQVQVALALGQWDEALEGLERWLSQAPQHAWERVGMLRLLTTAGELRLATRSLNLRHHVPLGGLTDADLQGRLAGAREAVEDPGNTDPVLHRWTRRAALLLSREDEAFNEAVEQVVGVPPAAALISLLGDRKDYLNLRRLVQRFSDHWFVLMASALALLGEAPQEALQLAQRAVALAPSQSVLALAALARALEANGHDPEALVSLEQALGSWPDEPEWQRWAAAMCARTGQDAKHIAHLASLVQLEPEDCDAALALGEAYLNADRPEETLKLLTGAGDILRGTPALWQMLGKAQLRLGLWQESLESVAHWQELSGDSAEVQLMRARALLGLGKAPEALEIAEAQMRQAPSAQVAHLCAEVMQATGDVESARAVLQQASAEGLGDFELELLAAELALKQEGPDKALTEVQALAERYPEEARGLALLAKTLAAVGESETAGRYAQMALSIQKNLPEMHLLVAKLHRESGNLDSALHHLAEAVALQPDLLDAYLELSDVYRLRGDYHQALKVLEDALKVAPNEGGIYYKAAMVLKEAKDYRNAEKFLRRAADLCPHDLAIHRALGAVIALNLVHRSQEAYAQ